MAEIVAGVRPIIRFASAPTAWISPESESRAITDGSDSTIPLPRTYTSVFAVPRSTATSRPVAGSHVENERTRGRRYRRPGFALHDRAPPEEHARSGVLARRDLFR